MAKTSKRAVFARRAWNVLRLALLWARKGGALKRGLVMDYIKSFKMKNHHMSSLKEREFSFDETPLFHFKMHRPNYSSSMRLILPCIKPQVDFDFVFDEGGNDDDDVVYVTDDYRRRSASASNNFLTCGDHGDEGELMSSSDHQVVVGEDEGIDVKAEEFIERFYEQMKLQRQLSYLQYTEMLDRGTN
ncbi:hypothetical protein Sjap_007323 [Stephania japonica]|uniref:Cotton fiber protein n=1 Tax=Stephania japonica TaxID=461633 RepID=A0AAP0JN09_9MAGN